MTKPELAIVGAIAIAGGIISCRIRHDAAVSLRETEASLRERTGQLIQLREEGTRLSNLIAQARSPQSLPDDELRELLRLRNEVGQLRGKRMEADQLQAANRQLQATLTNSQVAPAVQARWERNQLAYAGYADPESALITTLWGFNTGDANFFLSTLTPDEIANRKNKSDAEITAECRKIGGILFGASATGICLVGKKAASSDEVILDLYYEGEEKTRQFVMKRVGGEWKLQNLSLIIAN